MRCEETVKIIEILRLTEQGFSQRDIAKSAGCSKSTVGEIQKRSREIGVTYGKAAEMTQDELKKLIYPKAAGHACKQDPDFGAVREELRKEPHLNLRFLWEEYKAQHPEGLEYSWFCEKYNRWLDKSGSRVTMHQEREAGKELFVDWMGDTLPVVIDPKTGKTTAAHFFVCALGNSGYPYVEAFSDEKMDKWLTAHIHAFEYYGGVPRVVVPDNCKTAVNSPRRYDPALNPAYWELAKHYGVAVIPARVRKPQDKPSVEESVGWLETWLLGFLRNQRFFSFAELNLAIRDRVQGLVQRDFQKRTGSRLSVFEDVDKPALRPLNPRRFETADMVFRRVPDNYHVEYDGFYYSVPYTLYRQKVMLRATTSVIEIFDKDRVRVASHTRRHSGSRYATDPAHMPEKHRVYWESRQFNGVKYRSWAASIGDNTHIVIDRMLTSQDVEEQAYKACMGIMQMSKKYGDKRLDNACARALELHSCSYTTISNILKNGTDLASRVSPSTKSLPVHENVRGKEYYV